MSVFWVVTSSGLVGRYKRFGETYYLHLQSWHVCSKLWYLPTSPHCVTSPEDQHQYFYCRKNIKSHKEGLELNGTQILVYGDDFGETSKR
jgi:hypothetical protein